MLRFSIKLSWWDLFYAYAPWALVALAAIILLWALFADRSRGRRRCPRCWYDMQGVPGLRCPECGREARTERSLFRTHRRWRRAMVVVPLLLVAWGTACVPRVRSIGAVGLVPTWSLAAASLVYDTSDQRLLGELYIRIYDEAEQPSAAERWIIARRVRRALHKPDALVACPSRASGFLQCSAGEVALTLIQLHDLADPSLVRAATMVLDTSQNPSLRQNLIHLVVGKPNWPERVPLLVKVLRTDSDNGNRVAAAMALGSVHSDPKLCIPALIEGLNGTGWVPRACAEALGKYGRDAAQAVGTLNEVAFSQSQGTALAAMHAMLDIGTGDARDRLCTMAFADSPYVRKMSMQIMSSKAEAACGCARALKPEAAGEQEDPRRANAVSALARLSVAGCDVKEELVAGVTSAGTPISRADALEAIWSNVLLPDPEIMAIADQALNDSSPIVRREAAKALSAILPKTPAAAAPLKRAQSDPDEVVRHTATSALNNSSR